MKHLRRGWALWALVLLLVLPWRVLAADHLYWVIEGESGPAGYLLGTIHSEDPRVLDFRDGFLEELASCGVFAMELVPNQATLAGLAEAMHYPAGEGLTAAVGPSLFEAVASALDAYGMPAAQVDRLRPWAAMMTLSVPPPETGLFMDFALSLRADGMGLTVIGLETLGDQLGFLERMPEAQQLGLLQQAVADFDQVREVHDAMVDLYLTGDLAALQSMTDEQMDALDPATREAFEAEGIVARNHRMAAALLPQLKEGRVFAAVGALHLPGETGLVRLLEAEGYTLRPMPLPFVATP